MSDGSVELRSAPGEVDAIPLAELNPAQSALFQADAVWPYFERLRREDPIHFTPEGDQAAHWAVTRYNDIMAVDTNHEVFSSEGGITLPPSEARMQRMQAEGGGPGAGGGMFGGAAGGEPQGGGGPRMFIAMDPPKHDVQRKTVSPAMSPAGLALMEPLIRERAAGILDSLPIGEPFDWVDKVSRELTAMTLATLFRHAPSRSPPPRSLV